MAWSQATPPFVTVVLRWTEYRTEGVHQFFFASIRLSRHRVNLFQFVPGFPKCSDCYCREDQNTRISDVELGTLHGRLRPSRGQRLVYCAAHSLVVPL